MHHNISLHVMLLCWAWPIHGLHPKNCISRLWYSGPGKWAATSSRHKCIGGIDFIVHTRTSCNTVFVIAIGKRRITHLVDATFRRETYIMRDKRKTAAYFKMPLMTIHDQIPAICLAISWPIYGWESTWMLVAVSSLQTNISILWSDGSHPESERPKIAGI